MSLLDLCQWLQDTQIGTAIRESIWAFPIIETIHVLGLAISVGVIVWLDLRLMGYGMRRQSVSQVFRQIIPIAIVGYTIMVISGVLLFWSNAARVYPNIFFRMKVVFLILAAVNALVFQVTTYKSMAEWDKAPIPPKRARLAGLLSLILWMAVIAAGRATAYNLF